MTFTYRNLTLKDMETDVDSTKVVITLPTLSNNAGVRDVTDREQVNLNNNARIRDVTKRKRRNVSNNAGFSDVTDRKQRLTSKLQQYKSGSKHDLDIETALEWELIATILDRILLIIFVIVHIMTSLVLLTNRK